MSYSSHPEYINLTYVQLCKLQVRYNHDWADSTKVTNTDPVYRDDGSLHGISPLLTQVLHFVPATSALGMPMWDRA